MRTILPLSVTATATSCGGPPAQSTSPNALPDSMSSKCGLHHTTACVVAPCAAIVITASPARVQPMRPSFHTRTTVELLTNDSSGLEMTSPFARVARTGIVIAPPTRLMTSVSGSTVSRARSVFEHAVAKISAVAAKSTPFTPELQCGYSKDAEDRTSPTMRAR
jgi:hypothetical protein